MNAVRPIAHVWVPSYAASVGGIQQFSRSLIVALTQEFPDIEWRVLAKHDGSEPGRRLRGSGHWPQPLRLLHFTVLLLWAAWAERPVLILSTHIHFTPLARLCQRWWGIPFAAVAHGVEAWGLTNPRVIRALREAAGVLAVSRFTRDCLVRELALPAAQVQLLPNTVSAAAFQLGPKPAYLLKRYQLDLAQPIILTVSRLVANEGYKGYEQILRALPALRLRLPNVHYILGGQGDDAARMAALVQALGLETCVTLAGFIPETELNDCYNLCDVFAMPSRKEGFGIVFLEALACGKPVIAGNQDGSVDPLRDGRLGVLIDPLNLSALTEALHDVLTRQYPLPILSDPAGLRAQVLEHYGFPHFCHVTKRVISNLLPAR